MVQQWFQHFPVELADVLVCRTSSLQYCLANSRVAGLRACAAARLTGQHWRHCLDSALTFFCSRSSPWSTTSLIALTQRACCVCRRSNLSCVSQTAECGMEWCTVFSKMVCSSWLWSAVTLSCQRQSRGLKPWQSRALRPWTTSCKSQACQHLHFLKLLLEACNYKICMVDVYLLRFHLFSLAFCHGGCHSL